MLAKVSRVHFNRIRILRTVKRRKWIRFDEEIETHLITFFHKPERGTLYIYSAIHSVFISHSQLSSILNSRSVRRAANVLEDEIIIFCCKKIFRNSSKELAFEDTSSHVRKITKDCLHCLFFSIGDSSMEEATARKGKK